MSEHLLSLKEFAISNPNTVTWIVTALLVLVGVLLQKTWIKEFISEYGLDCDFDERGMLDTAMNAGQVKIMEREYGICKDWGLNAEVLYGKDLIEFIPHK